MSSLICPWCVPTRRRSRPSADRAAHRRDGSQLTFTFDAAAVPVVGNSARTTEHLPPERLAAAPGQIHCAGDRQRRVGAAAVRAVHPPAQTIFKLVHWSSGAQGAQHIGEGEDGMGFNLIYGDYRPGNDPIGNADTTLRGGADYMDVCTMSGAHQMDLRMECDLVRPLCHPRRYRARGGAGLCQPHHPQLPGRAFLR